MKLSIAAKNAEIIKTVTTFQKISSKIKQMIVKTKISFKEYVKLIYSIAYKKTLLRLLLLVAFLILLWIIFLLFAYFQPSQTNYIPIYYLDLNSYCAAITNLCDDMEKLLFQQPFARSFRNGNITKGN